MVHDSLLSRVQRHLRKLRLLWTYLDSLSTNSFAFLNSSSHSKSRGSAQWKFPSPTCPTIGAEPKKTRRRLIDHDSYLPNLRVNSFAFRSSSSSSGFMGIKQWKLPSPTCPTMGAGNERVQVILNSWIRQHPHYTPKKCKNAALFLQFGVTSTLIRHENGTFRKKNALQTGGIWKRLLVASVWITGGPSSQCEEFFFFLIFIRMFSARNVTRLPPTSAIT